MNNLVHKNVLVLAVLFATEVWGKVIFSQAYVSHSVQRGGGGGGEVERGSLYDVTSCLAAWAQVPSRGDLCPEGFP